MNAADTTPATALLAEFVSGFDADRLSEREKSVAKMGILDSLGVAIAGSRQPAGVAAAAYVRSQGFANGAPLWGHGFASAASLAALANGTAAHALDFDDVNWALVGHPSASLTPTVLAVAEQLDSPASEVLTAYACGFEVMTKIGRTCMPLFSLDGGWHATSAIGTIGNASAAAYLMKLTEQQVRHAIGIAVSEASGVVRNFGSMTKPLHAGIAAQSGIQAAELARQGFTSAGDAMEGKHGFYRTHGRGLPADLSWLAKLWAPSELETTGLVIKPYPCGVAGHPAIDAALELKESLTVDDLARVRSIELYATSYTIDKMRYTWPENELQAKFSLHYQVAKALLEGTLELRHFTVDALDDEHARRLVDVTSLHLDHEFDADWRRDGGNRPCRLVVTLEDGRQLASVVKVSRGDPSRPLSDQQLRRKFLTCAAPVLGARPSRRIIELVGRFGELPDVHELGRLLGGGPPHVGQ